MRADIVVCDRCGARLSTASDDDLPPYLRVEAKQWARDAGALDLCEPCWETIVADARQWTVTMTPSRLAKQASLTLDEVD